MANAIFGGSDTVMLSEETAKGRYPLESVRMLSKIAREIEPGLVRRNNFETQRTQTNPRPYPSVIFLLREVKLVKMPEFTG